MTNGSSQAFRSVVDQLAEVGFEMIFYSFGSGFDLESDNLTTLAADIAYANSKNLEVGGYDLIAWTRKVQDKWMARTNETFGACMASGWYDYLLDKIKRIRNVANLTAIGQISHRCLVNTLSLAFSSASVNICSGSKQTSLSEFLFWIASAQFLQ